MNKKQLSLCLLFLFAGVLFLNLFQISLNFSSEDDTSSDKGDVATSLTGAVSEAQDALATNRVDLHQALNEARRRIRPLTEYQATLEENQGAAFAASTLDQRLRARFLENGGLALLSGFSDHNWRAEMNLDIETLGVYGMQANGSELVVDHGNLEAFYKNRNDGLEHGFTIKEKVEALIEADTGDLVIPMSLDGVQAEYLPNSEGAADLQFVNGDGNAVVAYTGLKVWDSADNVLAASMHPTPAGFAIHVDDSRAQYPIHIDPLIASLETKLGPNITGSGNRSDTFGLAVSILGNVAAVGAPSDDDLGSESGSVYVFRNTGNQWVEEQKLIASDGAAQGLFGASVGVLNGSILIGAPGSSDSNDRIGKVYAFDFDGNNWIESAKVAPSFWETYSGLGRTMSLLGDKALIGAPDGDEGGLAFLFERSDGQWKQAEKLSGDTESGDLFAQSVSLSASTILIGAPNDDDEGSNAGAVYVFSLDNDVWGFTQKLTASDAALGDNFGQSVSVSGNLAIIGALDAGIELGGRTYAFSLDQGTWSEDQILSVAGITDLSFFGRSVALSSGYAFVGAYGDDSVYVFERTGNSWNEAQTLSGPEGSSFGFSLGFDGTSLIIGADREDTVWTDSGRSYIYTFDGSDWSEDAAIDAGEGGNSTVFGSSISLQGDLAAIGAKDDHDNGLSSGAVYIFRQSGGTWSEEAKLLASDGAASHEFGFAVALDTDTVLIGDPYDSVIDTRNGSAFVFVYDNGIWTEQQKLVASDGAPNDFFGNSVAIEDDYALVGARADDPAGINSGSIYAFTRNVDTWSQSQNFAPIDVAAYDEFGFSLAIDGVYAVIGSYRDDPSETNSGSAYVYENIAGTWTGRRKLTASDGSESDEFGYAVAIDGDTLAIGAPKYNFDSDSSPSTGAVYVFERSGDNWNQQQILTDSTGENLDYLGNSVSISGDTIAAGAPRSDSEFSNSGSFIIFEFDQNTWNERYKVSAEDPDEEGRFGETLALDGSNLLVGSPKSSGTDLYGAETLSQGAVYAYTLGDGYTLIVATVGQGNTDPSGSGGQISGALVSVTATPENGYRFEAWSGDFSGNTNPLEFNMTQDYTIVATFVEDTNDEDGDGLTNFREAVIFNTNPNLRDSNGDGFEDGLLVEANFDPNVDYGALREIIESQLEDARVGSVTIDVVDDKVVLQLQIERSSDLLQSWTAAPEDIVEIELPISAGREFFRFGIPPQN
ncbi:MAG: InlB B-repeat-containing protein [Opitutales bacterium]